MRHKTKKQLGQNFLLNKGVAYEMVDQLDLQDDDLVVEIGPGPGAVTRVLLERVKGTKVNIKAVEIDENLVEELRKKFPEEANLEIIEADILSWLPKFTPKEEFKVFGSLPYYITSPILHTIVRHTGNILKCVFLMQKEVAKKVAGKVPKASYLSTFVQTFFEVEIIKEVPRIYFDPQPEVDGAVIKMSKSPELKVPLGDINDFEKFLHWGFSKPRKMLNKVFPKEFLDTLGIDETLRPQHLTLDQWLEIYAARG